MCGGEKDYSDHYSQIEDGERKKERGTKESKG